MSLCGTLLFIAAIWLIFAEVIEGFGGIMIAAAVILVIIGGLRESIKIRSNLKKGESCEKIDAAIKLRRIILFFDGIAMLAYGIYLDSGVDLEEFDDGTYSPGFFHETAGFIITLAAAILVVAAVISSSARKRKLKKQSSK